MLKPGLYRLRALHLRTTRYLLVECLTIFWIASGYQLRGAKVTDP